MVAGVAERQFKTPPLSELTRSTAPLTDPTRSGLDIAGDLPEDPALFCGPGALSADSAARVRLVNQLAILLLDVYQLVFVEHRHDPCVAFID